MILGGVCCPVGAKKQQGEGGEREHQLEAVTLLLTSDGETGLGGRALGGSRGVEDAVGVEPVTEEGPELQ